MTGSCVLSRAPRRDDLKRPERGRSFVEDVEPGLLVWSEEEEVEERWVSRGGQSGVVQTLIPSPRDSGILVSRILSSKGVCKCGEDSG